MMQRRQPICALREAAMFLLVIGISFQEALGGGKVVSVKESIIDSAVSEIFWLGTDNKKLLLLSQKGRLYHSTNGGDAWKDITETFSQASSSKFEETSVVESISMSSADKNIAIVSTKHGQHWTSQDAGINWSELRHKGKIHNFMFHRTRPRWALVSTWIGGCDKSITSTGKADDGPCNHILFITKDLGKTFQQVTSYVVQFAWGTDSQKDRIFFTAFRQKSGEQKRLTLWSKNVDFSYTDDFGSSTSRLVYRGNKFIVSPSGFIFAAKVKDETSQVVVLMVSSDGGKTFNKAQLPQELDEKSYTILDTTSGIVMLHVNHGSTENKEDLVGNVYVSDAQGIRYSLSLSDNVRSKQGDCEFDRVLSMEGTYIANFRDNAKADGESESEDESKDEAASETADQSEVERKRKKGKGKTERIVRTVISFDKGAVWSYLKPPKVDSHGKKNRLP
jgi:hypothetical protein